jgi:uncharacterized LabA/DUF88 family protein
LTGNAPEEQRIALFIDFENIAIGVRDAHYRRFDINLVLERLVEKGKILTKRAYADWGRYGEYRRSFHEAAVELIEVPQKSVGGKNSADIRLVVDAMDMSFQKEHIDTFCIASGDSDFSPLVSKLKENDKYVIGLGVKNSTSDLLMENCDEFIFYEDLVRRQEKPVVLIPNIPEKLQEAFAILVDSVVALQLENKGALWGSMVKETMKRKKPSFNETYYGFRSFSSLLEDAQRRGVVTLRRDQKSGSYIVEDLGAAARGDGSVVAARPIESENASPASSSPPSSSSGDPGTGGPPSASNGNGGYRGEPRGDREPRTERRPAPGAYPAVVSAEAAGGAEGTPVTEDGSLAAEVEGQDGDSSTRPRRRRGGRGRGRGRDGREGGPRESRPDLEARSEEPNLAFDADEDSNPSIPTPPQAAAAYAQTVERMTHTDAPVFWEVPALAAPDHAPAAATPPASTEPRPAPPVAPVDPSKASFSLLGWLKGGG